MKTKKALIMSCVSLILCVSILIGSTWAWFTDSVSSGNNVITAGNLDVELEYSTDMLTWDPVKDSTEIFDDAILWEPGHTEVAYLRVSNVGDLSLQYQLGVKVASEIGSVNALGEPFALSDYIEFGVVENVTGAFAGRAEARAAVTNGTPIASGYSDEKALEAGAAADCVALVVYMPESVGNEANAQIGAPVPTISLTVDLFATQRESELDSFDNKYDVNAKAEFFAGFQGGAAGAVVTTDDQGATTDEVSMEGGDVSAVVPVGVRVADGANTLTMSVTLKETSEANIQLSVSEEMRPLDVHIEGVEEGNTVPILVTLKQYLTTGINTGALKLYHVENGVTVAMTQVANPANHNEFSYDPLTGDVTLALASFSEVAVVADTNNPWDGTTDTEYSGSGTEADPYLIANADQLAYFRIQVDGGKDFEGEFVKLNNNIYLSGQNFDPIGWGYANKEHNRDGAEGKVFKGTFDGANNTIYDLYQSGWDLETATGTDYTYTNCGFGLFAAASGATFKNLTINGASVTVECVEAGVLVGLSQNGCTYDNIQIYNAKIANYQRPAGGLIGEVSGEGTTTITDVTIGSDVVVGSLWGDFDAPCGGVIGARWDDAGKNPQIVMTNVEVGCRMDVYSDVTSAYQWYAYRRAGMLIGNTELTAENNEHLAAAPFLTCTKDADNNATVKVYYGDWAAYHYCQFTNQYIDWQNNYPWVRVEAGENNPAYSNPRYGHPDVDGVEVTSDTHTCTEHNMELPFNQLYGGGQGVYGQPVHDGVEVVNYRYSITYVNDYQVLAIRYVTEDGEISTANSAAQDLVVKWADANIGVGKYAFGGWMNAGSTKLEKIDATNTDDIVLYPYFNNPYTARFVDQQGNVVAYCFFHAEDTKKLDATKAAAEAALPDPGEDLEFDYWSVQITDNEGKVTSSEMYNVSNFAGYEHDVTIYPVYLYKGDVNLVPVDSDSDGIINYYQVAGYSNPNGQALVEIPASVNGIPVTEINDNAFASYDGVHSIVVPNGVTIGKNAFTSGTKFGDGEEITIYFEGTKDQWEKLTKSSGWDYGIGTGSRVFFLKDGKVDTTQSYLEVVEKWGFFSRDYVWEEKTDFAAVTDVYTGPCNCAISTTGDTAHVYVDGSGTVMGRNEAGTPVNNDGTVIYFQDGGWLGSDKLTDGTNTYYRYRPDKAYWEDITVN